MDLKDAGTGCPHVQKDESVGKKTNLVAQGAVTGTQEKRLWKKRQDALEDYKNVVRLCRKVRKVKPQLEISLATVVIGNKKCFYKYISNKRNAKERISILYCV